MSTRGEQLLRHSGDYAKELSVLLQELMPPETRDKCERMMTSCLKTLQEMKKNEQRK